MRLGNQLGLILLGVIVFFSANVSVWAYDIDVHFTLTYVICRVAGFTWSEAATIASADESLDDNPETTAFDGIIGTLKIYDTYQQSGVNWHAFAQPASPETIQKRELELCNKWNQPLQASSRVREDLQNGVTNLIYEDTYLQRLMRFGQFLHFRQDMFAHRHLSGDPANQDDSHEFEPYEPQIGHFKDGHAPDYVATRPKLAKNMAHRTLQWAYQFRKNLQNPSGLTPCSSEKVTLEEKLPPLSSDDIQLLDALVDKLASLYSYTIVHAPPVYQRGGSPQYPQNNEPTLRLPDQLKIVNGLQSVLQQSSAKNIRNITEVSTLIYKKYDPPKSSIFYDDKGNPLFIHP